MGLSDLYAPKDNGGGFDLLRVAQAKQPQGIESLNLTPQERFLYQHHLNNLQNGPVVNQDGSTSTLRQMSVGINGRVYNIPTVWNGAVVSPDEAIARARQVGLDKFPSYSSEGDAEARYQQMHKFIEQDTVDSLKKRAQPK